MTTSRISATAIALSIAFGSVGGTGWTLGSAKDQELSDDGHDLLGLRLAESSFQDGLHAAFGDGCPWPLRFAEASSPVARGVV